MCKECGMNVYVVYAVYFGNVGSENLCRVAVCLCARTVSCDWQQERGTCAVCCAYVVGLCC